MRLSVLIFTAILILWPSAYADVIYFKNGGTTEGIIAEENEISIVIDLGVGTMTVRKDEIETIDWASPEDNERLKDDRREAGISRGEWAPLGCEEVRLAYLKAKEVKESLKKLKAGSMANQDEILRKEKKIADLLKSLDKKSKELKAIDADKAIRRYNTVVSEINSLSAELNKENSALKGLYSEEKTISSNLMQKAAKYRGTFQELKDLLAGGKDIEVGYEMPDQELLFFEEMNEKVAEMESDFKKDIVNYISEENQIIVDALINGTVLARLIVDTGASIVVISRDVAERLGMVSESMDATIEIIMADGTSSNAKPVMLSSIKVGDAEVRNVQAAVLESSLVGGVDGLLGMSFLSGFVVSVDTSSKKLILEQVLEQ
ncbi:MAG: TIGR02281 family clan AA aspartic protease [Candidatus Omnitrophica bacterium]|nr:TIGR02281 family clan AA aspartic protease [Candidatus Omnitrophota bacterium]MBU4488152.1 TIGR02281 family clan AA aspartic protease [Candidatus Omnitrophota bacterium]MCG2704539.1 TIGR02281 family clan AA aspartic protease [Candidatus Omnitrophota bacterium]